LDVKKILLFGLFCLSPFISKSAAYWLEITGSGRTNEPVTISIIYGHIDEYSVRHRDTGKELDLVGEFKMYVLRNGQQTAVTLTQKADCWQGTFIPTHHGVYRILGINDTHPVIDRSTTGGKNVRPIDYLCTDYQVGDGSLLPAKPAQLLDIITSKTNGVITVKAFNNGKPAFAGTKLRIFNPENWEKELVLDEKGEAVFKTTMPGLYIIREDWDNALPGSYKGVTYVSIRQRCNYSLLVQ
jgi:hypothetical protein